MIFKSTKTKLKHYNIPPTDENHELLRKAKAAIAASNPDQALELFSTLKLKNLDIEITALSARLADLERTQRFGTESYDTETREHNKIKKSIIFLITALEKEIAQSFEFYDKIRAALKSRYETRLSQKLSNRQPVNLRLLPSTTGTTPQAANTFVQYSEGQIRGKLAEYYKDANGRLLLVGVPGAGKTTLLLQLELELLEKEITRIPVILNLARWSSTFPTLEAWIQEILPSEMGLVINKKVAGDLVTQNRLILLLDGLDEVKDEDRKTCLEAIGAYGGEDSSRCFIISSRIDEYKGIAKDAPVNGQVEVGILTYEQLIEQLEKIDANEGSQRLLAALKEDIILRKITEVPFYLNTLQLLFARGKYLHEFDFSALDIEGRKKEIERSFVFEMFKKIAPKYYDAQSIIKYLGFFASRLKRENLIDFELINLQYSWCTLSKCEYKIAESLEALILGVIYIFFYAMIGNLDGGLFFGLAMGIAHGLQLGSNTAKPIITTKENVEWDWSEIINLRNLLIGLIFGLLVNNDYRIFVSIIIAIVVPVCIGIILQLENHYAFIQINEPYQRFRASAKKMHFSILQHWYLCHLLHKKGILPKKLVPFLNDMVECNILETTGASWRFRHRILQDYFAGQWVETELESEQK